MIQRLLFYQITRLLILLILMIVAVPDTHNQHNSAKSTYPPSPPMNHIRSSTDTTIPDMYNLRDCTISASIKASSSMPLPIRPEIFTEQLLANSCRKASWPLSKEIDNMDKTFCIIVNEVQLSINRQLKDKTCFSGFPPTMLC